MDLLVRPQGAQRLRRDLRAEIVDAAHDLGQGRQLYQGLAGGDALRRRGEEDILPHSQPQILLHKGFDGFGEGSRGYGAPQHEDLNGTQDAGQGRKGALDLRVVGPELGVEVRADGNEDGVGGPQATEVITHPQHVGALQMLKGLLGAILLERHHPLLNVGQPLLVEVDADDRHPLGSVSQGQGEAHPTEADNPDAEIAPPYLFQQFTWFHADLRAAGLRPTRRRR